MKEKSQPRNPVRLFYEPTPEYLYEKNRAGVIAELQLVKIKEKELKKKIGIPKDN